VNGAFAKHNRLCDAFLIHGLICAPKFGFLVVTDYGLAYKQFGT
jgi:hypothetical protein